MPLYQRPYVRLSLLQRSVHILAPRLLLQAENQPAKQFVNDGNSQRGKMHHELSSRSKRVQLRLIYDIQIKLKTN